MSAPTRDARGEPPGIGVDLPVTVPGRAFVRPAVVLYFVLTPLTIASVFVAGHRVEVSLLCASLLAFMWLLAFFSGRVGVNKRADGWSVWFWLFIGASTASLLASPYLRESYTLGGIQLVGMVVILLASLYVSRYVASDSKRFSFCIRVLALIMASVAGIGVWQFIAFNVLDTKFLADFSFVNDLVGAGAEEQLWRDPGSIGGLSSVLRANSVLAEPAWFAQVLGMVGGIVLLRIGFAGRSLAGSLAGIIPRWAALLVIAGFGVALSIVGYLLLALTVVSLVVLLRFDLRFFSRIILVGAIAATPLVGLLALGLGEELVEKLTTVPLVVSAVTGGVQVPTAESVSALALSANLSVALDNVMSQPLFGVGPGGHPQSYAVLVPDWLSASRVLASDLYGTHQQDGGALLIRLLSETGLIGTILFLAGWLIVVVRARRAIRRALTFESKDSSWSSPTLALAIGVTASCMALVSVYLIRMAVYYDPPIWVLIALTAAVPPLLDREYGHRTGDDEPSTSGG
jgi:hypothetical protein